MADVTITANSVFASTGAVLVTPTRRAGVNIAAGQSVYLDTNKKWQLADTTTTVKAAAGGIAQMSVNAGLPLDVQKEGDMTIGGTLVTGTMYVVSDTPGGIKAVSALSTGEHLTILGFGKSATVLTLAVTATGVTAP